LKSSWLFQIAYLCSFSETTACDLAQGSQFPSLCCAEIRSSRCSCLPPFRSNLRSAAVNEQFNTRDETRVIRSHLYAQIRREKGKLDIVFANAGVAKFAALGTITEELYDWTFDINVKGLLFTVQKALPLLPDGASIILNSSVVGSKGLPINSVYSATKAAIRSFARTWTTDLKDRRIRVNAVSPGSIDTPGLSGLLGSPETGQQRLKNISSNVPLGRLGTPDEIAKAVVFLASDDASFVTGAELFVDGGFAQV
jgi:NAD(P)-dependent dehydrogenase (short-subunit alcohol dehydrogenase family)